jgi:hypothetical protein
VSSSGTRLDPTLVTAAIQEALPDILDETLPSTYMVRGPLPTGLDQAPDFNAGMLALSLAGGGAYRLRAGVYLCDTLKVPSNVKLQGHALGYTTIRLIAGAVGDAAITNLSYYTFAAGAGAPDPSWVPRETNVGVENLTVDGNKDNVANRYGIIFRPCDGVRIKHVRVINTGLTALEVMASKRVRIDDYESAGATLNGLYLLDCIDFRVDGVLIDGCGDYGVEIGSGADYGSPGMPAVAGQGTVSNVVARNCTNFGVCVRGVKDATANPTNRPIRGVALSNIVAEGNGIGVGMQELAQSITWTGVRSRLNTTGALFSVGAGGPVGKSSVEGDFCDNTQDGLASTAATDMTFRITALRNGRNGVAGSFADCAFLGSTIRNNSTASPGTYDNLSTSATSSGVDVLACDLRDRGARTARYDINGNSQDRIIATGCDIEVASGMQYGAQLNVRTVARQTMAAGAGGAIDPRAASHHIITLTGHQTDATFIAPGAVDGQIITIEWKQGGAGSYTYLWPNGCKFNANTAPVRSTAVGLSDIVTFRYDAPSGGYLYEQSRAVGVPAT